MSEAYDWSWLRHGVPVIDLDIYLAMPEDVSRRIEVRDGMLVHCESGSPNHVSIAHTFQQAFRDAVRKRRPHEDCLRASGEFDMLISEVPFTFRRPDALVYRCVEDERGKWKTKPTAADTLLVVEVVSQSTVTVDCIDKRAEYARLGIQQYWIARMENNDGRVKSIEMLQLTSDGRYVTEDVRLRSHHPVTALSVIEPLAVAITWEDLDLDLD